MNEICPNCENGTLERVFFANKFVWGEKGAIVGGLAGKQCDHCGEVLIDAEDCLQNHEIINRAKASVTGD